MTFGVIVGEIVALALVALFCKKESRVDLIGVVGMALSVSWLTVLVCLAIYSSLTGATSWESAAAGVGFIVFAAIFAIMVFVDQRSDNNTPGAQ